MATYFTRKAEVNLAPGQSLKFRKGKGYYAGGTALPYAGYLSPQQQLALANQQASSALLPSVQANQAAQAQAREDARNAAAAGQAGYNALATLQAGIPDQIAGLYGKAADRQAAYGKGFSTDVGNTLDASTGAANKLLGQNNSNLTLASPGTSAKDVLYALGGYSPASLLNQQGSAFSAAAKNLPGESMGLGLDAATAARASGAKNVKDLVTQLAGIQAQRPGQVQQALSGIQNAQQQSQANAIQQQYLTNTLANGVADRTGIDPVTGAVKPGYAQDPKTGAIVPVSTITARTTARTKAITKRNDSTVAALAKSRAWLEKQPGILKEGTQPQKVADVPIKIGTTKVGKVSTPVYAKAGGGTTTNPAEAATKAVYEQTGIPKPQFDAVVKQITGQLSTQLRRFGYKPAAIRAFALDIVDDYYTPTMKPGRKLRRSRTQLPPVKTGMH